MENGKNGNWEEWETGRIGRMKWDEWETGRMGNENEK